MGQNIKDLLATGFKIIRLSPKGNALDMEAADGCKIELDGYSGNVSFTGTLTNGTNFTVDGSGNAAFAGTLSAVNAAISGTLGVVGVATFAAMTINGLATLAAGAKLTPSGAPGTPAEGMLYYDSAAHKLKVRTAAAWETVTSA